MPRRLENWLETYKEWTLDRSETPESMIVWTGLFTLASVVKRHASWPPEVMGSYSIYPNLYIILVGPPGVVRKSTTARYAEDLLGEIASIRMSSSAISDSKLVELLSEVPDGSLSIMASEFATFVNVSQESMYDLLTDLFDGKLKHDHSTWAHGVNLVENPCLNLLAATTPSWVSNQMPAHVIGGGFASRVIFIFENTVRQRKLYYDIDWTHYEGLRKQLINDLSHIEGLEGTFKHESTNLRNRMEEWYALNAESSPGDERTEGYWQRRHIHLHKISGLLSVAERDDLVITEGHFEQARDMLEAIEGKMGRVFSAVGKNPYAADLEAVNDFLIRQGSFVPFDRIMARFYQDLDKSKLTEVLIGLVAMGKVERIDNFEGAVTKIAYRAL